MPLVLGTWVHHPPANRPPPAYRYDNEWGYSARFVDVARMVVQSL